MQKTKFSILPNIVPIFTLIALELLYFSYGVNSRSILYPSILHLSSNAVEDIVTRSLLFLIEISTAYVILSARCSNSADISIMQCLKCFAPILGIRIISDIALFAPMPLEYTKLLQVLLDTIYIFLLFIIISKRISTSSKKCKFAKKQVILSAVVLGFMILMLLYIITSYKRNIELINYISSKYITEISNKYLETMAFKNDVFIALYYFVISIIIYFFYGPTRSEDIKQLKKNGEISKILIRCFFIAFCFVFLIVIKMWFFPYRIISRISVDKRNVVNYSDEVGFDTTFKELNIYRISKDDIESCCYSNHKTYIIYGNKQVAKFDRNAMFDSDDLININSNLFIYNNQAILQSIDNKPVVYMAEDINSQPNTPELTESLKQIIGQGYFEYLENSYDYMLLNSPDYLKEALLDYKNGKFLETNKHLNTEFINEFVDSALKKDFT